MEKSFTIKFEPEGRKAIKKKTETALNAFNERNFRELFEKGYTRVKKNNVWFVENGWTVDYGILSLNVLFFTPVIEGDFLKQEFLNYVASNGEIKEASDTIQMIFPD